MKTKTKIYSFAITLLFLSVFFVGIKSVKAENCDGTECSCVEYNQYYGTDYDCGGDTSQGSGEPISNTQEDCGANATLGGDGQCYCNPGFGEDDNGDCIFLDLNTTKCQEDSDCVANVKSGYKCDSDGDCVPDSIFSGKECNDNADCTRIYGEGYTCSGFFSKTCESSIKDSVNAAPTAEDKKDAANKKAIAVANTAKVSGTQDAVADAKKIVEIRCQATGSGSSSTEGCANATKVLQEQQQKLQMAMDAATASVDAANAAAAIINPSTTTGAGFSLCANGILATICEGGGGTPYVAGISSGNYGGGSSGGFGSYGGGSGMVNGPKCEAGFEDIGGVCFPGNTGLSNAPIYVIVSNIFSWLMGLFTTLAVVAFVVSGIQYFMASGDEHMAETAKDNAKNASIGILVGLSGFIIIKAIAAALSGTSYFF